MTPDPPSADSSKLRRTRSAATTREGRAEGGAFVQKVRDSWRRLLAVDPIWIVLFVATASWVLAPGERFTAPDLAVGDIATRDYLAPHDALLLDEETTRQKRERARLDTLPVYDFDTGAPVQLEEELGRLFALGRARLAGAGSGQEADEAEVDLLARLAAETSLRIERSQLELLVARQLSSDLEDRLRGLVSQAMRRGVVAGKAVLLENRERGVLMRDLITGTERIEVDLFDCLGYPDELREMLSAEVRGWSGWRSQQRGQVVELLLANISPNLYFNQSETQARAEAAAAAVEQVYTRVRGGQVIARKGDQIGLAEARLIQRLAEEQSGRGRLLPLLGLVLLLSLLVLSLWLGVRRERVSRRRATVLGELLLMMTISLLGVRLALLVATSLAGSFTGSPFDSPTTYQLATPFASLALISVLLHGRSVALLASVLFSLLVGLCDPENAWSLAVYSLAGSLGAVFLIEELQFKQRSLVTRAGLFVGGVNGAAALMLAALSGRPPAAAELGMQLACALGGGVLVAAVVSFLLPVLESLFGVATGIKLVELANTNLPLLRRLAFEAPGSFQHSLMVANLAKAGCQAIGADSVLAYTAALYHDIGKIFRSEYFVENQRPGHNPHDKLQPSMSALILINHVKDGVELAHQHHLPAVLIDAIEQHHGTRLIKFFHQRALEQQDPESGEVSEEKFRYPGPRPKNRVMGILMLADGIEAASRSLNEPSAVRLRSVIKAIVDDCLRDGQLDDTDLTLGELSKVSEAFQEVLSHIYHRRIDYPGFNFNAPGKTATAEPAVPKAS